MRSAVSATILLMASTALAAGCHRGPAPATDTHGAEAMPPPDPIDGNSVGPTDAADTAAADGKPAADSCATALRALAAGDYRDWSGLTEACTVADAETALGPGGAYQTGFPGGSPTRFRTHPA